MASISIPLPQLHFGKDDTGFFCLGISWLNQTTRLATKYAVMVKFASLSEQKAIMHGSIIGDHFVWDEGNGNVHAVSIEQVRNICNDAELPVVLRSYYQARLRGEQVPYPDLESAPEEITADNTTTEVASA